MNIVVLTGAGVSAESGLPTFPGEGGLWKGHDATELARPEAFAKNPALVQEFYNFRRRMLMDPKIQPNAAHQALASLESRWTERGLFTLVTQNVDNLHERAGMLIAVGAIVMLLKWPRAPGRLWLIIGFAALLASNSLYINSLVIFRLAPQFSSPYRRSSSSRALFLVQSNKPVQIAIC